MNTFEFEQLCREASLELRLEDTAALGSGRTVEFGGVLFEAAFRDGRDNFVLMAELGAIEPENKVRVYESLLMMQLLTWDRPGTRFGFSPERQTAMLCIEAWLGARPNGAWLAHIVRSIAQQVPHWRETLLAGKLETSEVESGLEAALADFAPSPR